MAKKNIQKKSQEPDAIVAATYVEEGARTSLMVEQKDGNILDLFTWLIDGDFTASMPTVEEVVGLRYFDAWRLIDGRAAHIRNKKESK